MESQLLLDRYALEEKLGSGSGGIVDLAWDTRMRRNVAIKRIPLPLYRQSETIPGLEEARTAAKLSDHRIVSVHDFEETETEALLIMEFIDGISLGKLMDSVTSLLSVDEIASIVQNVGKALQYAHNHNVLHLDIKPDNIMIDEKGNAKVTDFGLGRLGSEDGYGLSTGGTIGYMPVEQLSGDEVSEATDEWAFAILIYELTTGDNPFFATSFAQSEALITQSDIYLPSCIREELDEGFDDVIFKALSIKPENRYESIGDFVTELMPYLGEAKKGKAQLKKLISTVKEPIILGSPKERQEAFEALNNSGAENPELKKARLGFKTAQISDDDNEFYDKSPENDFSEIDEDEDSDWQSDKNSGKINPYDERIIKKSSRKYQNSEDEIDEDNDYDSLPYSISMREKLANIQDSFERSGAKISAHLLGALCCGLTSGIGFANMGIEQGAFMWLGIGVLAIVGGVFPRIGSGLSLVILGIATIISGWIAQGAILLLLSLLWWIFLGISGDSESNCAVLAPSASLIGLGILQPLTTGYMLPIKKALFTSAFAVALMLLLAPITSNTTIFKCSLRFLNYSNETYLSVIGFYSKASTWLMVGGWILCSVCVSVFSIRKGLITSILGVIVGGALVIALMIALGSIDTTLQTAVDAKFIICIAVEMLLSIFLVWLYVPE